MSYPTIKLADIRPVIAGSPEEFAWPTPYFADYEQMVTKPPEESLQDRGGFVEDPENPNRWLRGRRPIQAPVERTISVLNLCMNYFPATELEQRGIRISHMTALLNLDPVWSRDALRIAQDATPEDFDLVVASARDGGSKYLGVLSNDMRARTLVGVELQVVDDAHQYRQATPQEIATVYSGFNVCPISRYGIADYIVDTMLPAIPPVVREDRNDIEIDARRRQTLFPGDGGDAMGYLSRSYDNAYGGHNYYQ